MSVVAELEKVIDWTPTKISRVAVGDRAKETSFGMNFDASKPPNVRLPV